MGLARLVSPQAVRDHLHALYGDPSRDQMTPYERVDAAVNLRQPDRVPFDYWAVPEVWEKIRKYLNADDEHILRLLGVDLRIVMPEYIGPPPETLPDGTFFNILGSHRRLVSNDFSTYEEYASFPLAEAQSVSEVETWDKWSRSDYFDWNSVIAQVQRFNRDIRYYIRYDVGGIFESAWGLYGLDRFLTALYDRPEIPCAIMDCYTDLFISNVERLMAAANGLIDMVYTYDDVAIQNSLMMSPKMWRKFILPRHQRLNEVIKRFGLKIMYHSCGAVYPLVGALIEEMKIDILNPLQPKAAGMDMQRIKDEFGSRVAFHGAIDLQETMSRGTPADVENEVRHRCTVLGRGGGYICATAHYIQGDAPLENILAMYTASRAAE